MKKILKKFSLLLLVSIFLLTGANVFAEKEITLVVNGNLVASDEMPFIEDGRTLVPVRVISENLGYKVDWDSKSRKVKVSKDNESIILRVNDKNVEARHGNVIADVYIDVPPEIVKNRVYVPVRFIAETYGEKISWDDTNRMVIVGEYEMKLKGDINLESRVKREYPELDLVMYLPKDFDDKILTGFNIENNSYDFYTKNRSEYLGSLSKAYKRSNINIIPTVILKYEDGFFTEINYASDVQYSEKTKSDYLKKLDYLKESFSTIEFVEGLEKGEKKVAYINSIDLNKRELFIDPAEFISINDIDRKKDLMLPELASANVYNDKDENINCKLPENVKFYIREKDDVAVDAYEVDGSTFKKYVDAQKYKSPFWINSNGDESVELVEIYIN